jgi:uncharacterized protein (TIGR02001 family)
MKKILLLVASIFALGTAHADWNKSITANTDNRVRGISQNETKVGLEFDINQTFKNGFYVGTKIPTVSGALGYGFHVDPYGGYKFSPVTGLTVDVGTMNYLFPKVTKYITNEIYTNISYSIFTVKANRSVSNYFSYPNSNGSTYYEIGVDIPVTSKITAHAHTGKVSIANNSLFNYQTNQVAVSYQYLPEWSVTGTYIENKNLTDIAKQYGYIENGHKLYKDTFVISLKRIF